MTGKEAGKEQRVGKMGRGQRWKDWEGTRVKGEKGRERGEEKELGARKKAG